MSFGASNDSTLLWLHLHSKIFPTTSHTPKSKLKRRSYGPDKLDKENCRNRENSVATKFSVTTEKLYRDRENYVATKFSVATEKTLSSQRKLCHDKVFCHDRENSVATEKLCCNKNAEKKPKKAENGYFGLFSRAFHPRTINT